MRLWLRPVQPSEDRDGPSIAGHLVGALGSDQDRDAHNLASLAGGGREGRWLEAMTRRTRCARWQGCVWKESSVLALRKTSRRPAKMGSRLSTEKRPRPLYRAYQTWRVRGYAQRPVSTRHCQARWK